MGPASQIITSLLIPLAALGHMLKKLLKISLFVCLVLALGQLRIQGKVVGEHFLEGVKSAWNLAGNKLTEKGISMGSLSTAPPIVKAEIKKAQSATDQALAELEAQARDQRALKELLKGK